MVSLIFVGKWSVLNHYDKAKCVNGQRSRAGRPRGPGPSETAHSQDGLSTASSEAARRGRGSEGRGQADAELEQLLPRCPRSSPGVSEGPLRSTSRPAPRRASLCPAGPAGGAPSGCWAEGSLLLQTALLSCNPHLTLEGFHPPQRRPMPTGSRSPFSLPDPRPSPRLGGFACSGTRQSAWSHTDGAFRVWPGVCSRGSSVVSCVQSSVPSVAALHLPVRLSVVVSAF